MKAFLESYLSQLDTCLRELDPDRLQVLADKVHEARLEGRTVFIVGNGGSASTASHFACDFAKGAGVEGVPPIKALSLTDNVAWMTAISNDVAYDSIFAEQLRVFGNEGDLVITISASGNSPSILEAVRQAKGQGMYTVGLIGFAGGALRELVDLDITLTSTNYGPVEDVHLILDHLLSQYLKRVAENG